MIKQSFSITPVMLLTATAPRKVFEKMKAIVSNPVVFQASVDRPNLLFKAEKSKYGGKIPKAVLDGKTSSGRFL